MNGLVWICCINTHIYKFNVSPKRCWVNHLQLWGSCSQMRVACVCLRVLDAQEYKSHSNHFSCWSSCFLKNGIHLAGYTLVIPNPLMHYVILSYLEKGQDIDLSSSAFYWFLCLLFFFTISDVNLFPKTTWKTPIMLFFSILNECTVVAQCLTMSFSQFYIHTYHSAFQLLCSFIVF